MSRKGIDVSKWQNKINWKVVKTTDVKFAMIRLGYGSSTGETCVIDPFFKTNINSMLENDIDFGIYFYSYAKSAEAAKKEAEYVIKMLAPYKNNLKYPVAFDLEDKSQKALGKVTLTAMVTAFCDTIENAGYFASLYSNVDWCKRLLNMDDLKAYDLWLAQWAAKPSTAYPIGMWQYTSSGTVPGISGRVDMNIAYKDYPSIISNMMGNPLPQDTPEPPKENIEVPEKRLFYVVKKGDNLTKIAKAHNITLASLIGANPQIKEPNVIYVGQTIIIP